MSIKTTITCDKCGKVIEWGAECKVRTAENADCDLCPQCAAEFEKWLNGGCKCEKAKAGKPAKKLPSGWTVQALASEMGRNRSTVQQALGSLSPKPERRRVRDSKTHWWYEYHLTTAQFNELKKRFGGAK